MNIAPINTIQTRNNLILNSTKSKKEDINTNIHRNISLAGSVVEDIIAPHVVAVHLLSLEL